MQEPVLSRLRTTSTFSNGIARTWAACRLLYVTDIAILPHVRVARDAYIDTAKPPASAAVQVVALFSPVALLEIEAYAVVPD